MKISLLLFVVCGVLVEGNHQANQLAAFDQIERINEKITSIYETPSYSQEPELFEGDIIWTQSLKNDVNNKAFGADQSLIYSDAINNGAWSRGIIPYVFDSEFNVKGREIVKKAVAQFSKHTCIKWIPRTNENDYVSFFHGRGCYSYIGKQGEEQQISLSNPNCLFRGIAMHEMMHCAGFYHEQSRRDRDNYISVHFSNINPQFMHNFQMYREGRASTLGEPYDKQSIMHYGNFAFSKNGGKTITSLSNPTEVMGQRIKFSKIDIQQLNKYYNCKGKMIATATKKCVDNFQFCPNLKNYCNQSWVFVNCKKTCMSCYVKKSSQKKAKRRRLAKANNI